MNHSHSPSATVSTALAMLFCMARIVSSQVVAAPPVAPVSGTDVRFTDEQLRNLVAPFALYPDPLLAQVLPASTYPVQVVLGARWLRAHPSPSEAAIDAMPDVEPCVKALLHYPPVLFRMDESLDSLQSLGIAFLNQQPDVMKAIQELRLQAQIAGKLKDTPQQQVIAADNNVEIQPANPQIIYVPQYDQQTVYVPGDDSQEYLFGAGFPLGIWLDNSLDWQNGWVAGGGGWHHGWERDHGRSGYAGQVGSISRPWERDRSQPMPMHAAPPAMSTSTGVRPGYEQTRIPAFSQNAFNGYRSGAGVEREINRAQQSRPAAPARSVQRTEPARQAPARVFRSQGGGRAVQAQSARGHASMGASRGGGGGGGGRRR